MNFRTKKNLLLTAAIAGCIMIVVNILIMCLIIWMPDFVFAPLAGYDQLFEFAMSLRGTISIFIILFSVCSLVGYIFCFVIGNYTEEKFNSKIGLYIASIIIIFLTGNVISLCLIIISLFAGNEKSKPQIILPVNEMLSEDEYEISELKALKENGSISDEEYNKRLSKIVIK